MRSPTARSGLAILLVCPIFLTACGGDDGVSRPRDNSFSAEEELSIQIDVDGQTSFRVEGISGGIGIAGAQGTSQVQIAGVRRVESDNVEDAEQSLENLEVEHSETASQVSVRTTQPDKTGGRNYIVNYTITLPNNLEVGAVNVTGNVSVESIQNDVNVTNAAGSISVAEILGGVSLTQEAGPIDASVTLPFGETISITAGTGDISLEIPQSTSATLSATVGVGGISVSNLTLTNEVQEPGFLSGTIGKGHGTIVLATSVGNISITGTEEIDDSIGFPLEDYSVMQEFGNVNPWFDNKYHCAEDANASAGTPVYAIADGVISYSGQMAGYGWLIAIDHPSHGVYSLYGHLSTRLSKSLAGEVRKGDVIAYIADDDEDGSGGDYPDWGPHLHFAIRQGSRYDYPSSGADSRWMAGYTTVYPTSLGWVDPTGFILEHSD